MSWEPDTLFEQLRRQRDRMNGGSDECVPGWLFVLSWSLRHTGGVNQVVKSLIGQFRSGGTYCPHFLCGSKDSMPSASADPDPINALHLDIWSPVNHERPLRGWISFIVRLPYRCLVMRRIVRQHSVRVINPHFPDLGSLSFLVLKKLKLFNGKLILSFHQSDLVHALSTKGGERKLWRILLRGVDHIVVVSKDSAANVLKFDSSIAQKLSTVPNGVDLDLFCSREDGALARSSSSHQEKMIVSVGKFAPLKGHDVLIRAFGYLLKSVPDARLMIVGGDGSEFEPLRQLIDSLALTDRVRLCKDVPHEQIPAILSQAQLFVLASRQEGHPLAVVEAGAAGLPIVCTEGAWSQELISDGVTGRLVAQGDERGLASAMAGLLSNKKEAQQMAARFHEYVKKNLTWGQACEKYRQLGLETAGNLDYARASKMVPSVSEKKPHQQNSES
jgi:glycosyltransferase involved in cell wall biosynthesis